MELELQNVGKIKQANIELNGITVIAGENNTGKSTVGKMLYCVFHSFYHIEEQIKKERLKTISRALNNFYIETTNHYRRDIKFNTLAESIVDQKQEFLEDTRLLVKEMERYYLKAGINFEQQSKQEALEQLADKIYTFLELDDEEIRKVILKKRLDSEFAMKISHLNCENKRTSVKLAIKKNTIEFEINNNQDIMISKYMNLNKEIIYFDDPFILDDLNPVIFRVRDSFEHRYDLLEKISFGKKPTDFTLVDELVAKKKLDNIFNAMNTVCDGNLLRDEGETFVYKTEKLNGNLDIVNLSTGMKSFIVLRQLLQNGSIDENGIIILDEPEIHLHPEWQLKFAECIVLIHKEFGANILLNTHSPYFLNAIEVYSERYEVGKNCRYYLTDEEDGETRVLNVTNKTEAIYAKLARPLQELENLEYRNGHTI